MEVGGPHHLPHFHAYYQDEAAVFSIEPIELIAGALSRRQRRLVEAWAELHQADVPPGEHLLDAGYVSSRVLVSSHKRFGIDVLGPAPVDSQWQAQTKHGIDASQFVLDWEHKQATCPEGHTSRSWASLSDKRHPELVKIQGRSAIEIEVQAELPPGLEAVNDLISRCNRDSGESQSSNVAEIVFAHRFSRLNIPTGLCLDLNREIVQIQLASSVLV